MTENEKTELFDKWYNENYDEWAEGEEGIALREELEQAFKSGVEELENKIADIKANCDLAIEGRDIKIKELEQQIGKMKCCANCKSFKGYGETCEGWGEPVLNLNCDCTEWELKEIEK